MKRITATLFSDPGCPWAYSVSPALRVLEWRYRDQLDWRLVVIGLTDTADQYVERGYTPLGMAQGHARYRRFGMPFSPQPRSRVTATGKACRAIVAARLLEPGSEWRVYRALQFAWFTTSLLLDEEADLREVLSQIPGVDSQAILATLDQPDVSEAYERDKAESRTAAGSPAELQGKTAQTEFTPGEAVSQRHIARLLSQFFDHVLTIDPHLHRIASLDEVMPVGTGFALSAAPVLGAWIAAQVPGALLIGPDEESAQWVREAAACGGLHYAIGRKVRHGDAQVSLSLPDVEVAGRAVVLVDDMASTGRTLIGAAQALLARGAASVDVAVTHALFNGDALPELQAAGVRHVWSSNAVPHQSNAVSVVPLLAAALKPLLLAEHYVQG